jgi:hypothetical protein
MFGCPLQRNQATPLRYSDRWLPGKLHRGSTSPWGSLLATSLSTGKLARALADPRVSSMISSLGLLIRQAGSSASDLVRQPALGFVRCGAWPSVKAA